jgi:DNA polymerase III subunit delta'
MQFNSIVGLQSTKQHLIDMVAKDRIPHAIMLNGQKGNGGLPLAVAFAQFVMCTNRTETDSCGACSNCQKFSKLQHIDVHFSFPIITPPSPKEPVSNHFVKEFRAAFLENPYMDISNWLEVMEAENKQANISAKECREVIKKLQLRSFEGGFKFLIMWLPEFMGKEGNILLKQIEEPSVKTIMIFVTEHYDGVLGTIQSRTQLIPLPALSDAEIYAALIADGISEKSAAIKARMAEGNYALAMQTSNHKEEGHFGFFKDWLNVLFTQNGVGISNWVLQLADQSKETQKNFLTYTITMMEHLVRCKWVGKDNLLLSADEANLIEKMIEKNISDTKAGEIAELCAEDIYAIERNANTKIVLQSLSLKVKDVFHRQ